ncbi:MAG: anti-sigma factor [Nitrospira sp.]|nr:anti-sigma factor [Nitrospira sp.]
MTRDELKNRAIDYLAGKVTCKEFTEAATDYLEGSQTWLGWVRFQMHLGLCPGCRAYLRQMKKTIHTLGRLPEEPIPPAVRDELLQRFRTGKSR